MGETVQIQSLVCSGKGGGVLVQLHSLCMFDYIREREWEGVTSTVQLHSCVVERTGVLLN